MNDSANPLTSDALAHRAPIGARDYRGLVHLEYAPDNDGEPDPGEVVWAWVPYEEDHSRGKDRPLVIIGRPDTAGGAMRPTDLAAFLLSSKDHADDHGWVAIGPGGWDADGRDSWVRVDRLLVVDADDVRREGATLQRGAYDRVIEAAQQSARR